MTEYDDTHSSDEAGRSNVRLAAGLLLFVGGMVGLSYAAVPLYQLFCQVTGYAGTTQRAEAPSTKILDRTITVRFDSSTSSELAWSFHPVQTTMELKIGENKLAFYEAENQTDQRLTGTATFNVTPAIAGAYFTKVDCFCFTEQTLQPGQRVDMPVSFYVDPAIADDPDAKGLEEITLSYTFFKVDKKDQPTKASSAEGAATRSFEKMKPSG